MIKSLRFRLFLSYVAVTLLIILVAGLTLGLIWRSAQTRIISTRLSESLPLTTRLVRGMLHQGVPPEEIAAQVAGDFRRRKSRMILVHRGIVLGDTANGEMVGKRLPLRLPEKSKLIIKKPLTGVFVGPDGRDYFYALATLRAPPELGGRAPIWVVEIAPRRLTGFNDEMAWPLFWALLTSLFIGLAFSWLISRWITQPLTAIARAADEIAQGNLDFKLQISGPAEVEHVARQFNAMAAEVRASRQAQRDFIANVSHDLKTPLTAIQGFSQALVEEVATDPQSVQRAAQIIHEESQRMGRLVDQLLDLAKLEAGRVRMRKDRLELGPLVQAAARRFQPAYVARGVDLALAVEPDLWIMGDEERLRQALMNLLDNALRYSPEGGVVSCVVRRFSDDPATAEVVIRDAGPGISAVDLPHVFERFYQAEKARRRGGSGLGLAIVQEIVRAHGGRVGVYSTPGQGASFWVRLPLA